MACASDRTTRSSCAAARLCARKRCSYRPTNSAMGMPRRHASLAYAPAMALLVLHLADHAAGLRAPLMPAGPRPTRLSAVRRSSAAGGAEGRASDEQLSCEQQLSRAAVLRGAASIAVSVAAAIPSGAVPLNAPPPVLRASRSPKSLRSRSTSRRPARNFTGLTGAHFALCSGKCSAQALPGTCRT